jgi:hypothetical protein
MRAADVPDVARIATAIESRRAFEHQNRRPVTPRRNCSAQRGIAAADDKNVILFCKIDHQRLSATGFKTRILLLSGRF